MTLARNPACNPLCNVCHYKGLEYEAQLEKKQKWAALNLAEWASALLPIVAAPAAERLNYRSKTWLQSFFDGKTLSLGKYRAVKIDGRWEREFTSWNTCPIHARPIQEMMTRLREVLVLKARSFSSQSLFGIWMGRPHVVLVAEDRHSDALQAIDWNEILMPPFDRVWLHRTRQVGKTVFQNRKFHQLAGPPPGHEPPILAFRQVSHTLLSEARRLACAYLLAPDPSLVVDLYCGTGELSRLIPLSIGWLGIEASKSAAEYAGKQRQSSGVLHRAYAGTVEQRFRDPRVLEQIVGRYSLYVNPPRSGLSVSARSELLAKIEAHPPAALVFLSCSASSLARDLGPFERLGYKVTRLQPYDFFPQTEHFEILAVLEKKGLY